MKTSTNPPRAARRALPLAATLVLSLAAWQASPAAAAEPSAPGPAGARASGKGAPKAAPLSDDAKAAGAVIERCVDSVLSILKNKALGREAKKERVKAAVDPVFDLVLMGKLALGRANWPKLNEAQRKEFTELFVRTVQDSYFEKVDLFTDEKVEIDDPVMTETGKFEMMTHIISKDQRYKLLYKLYKGPAGWKVYDVEIEGISLVRSYGSQYDQFLQKGSPAELLRKMREKSLAAPKELDDVKPSTAAAPGGKPAPPARRDDSGERPGTPPSPQDAPAAQPAVSTSPAAAPPPPARPSDGQSPPAGQR